MAKFDQRERAKEYLLANPTATNRDAAASVGVSARTISYARSELVDAGLIPPSWGDHKGKPKGVSSKVSSALRKASEGDTFETQNTADLNAAVEKEVAKRLADLQIDEEEIDFSKLKRILWRIVRTSPDDRIRTHAAWTLTRIQQDGADRPLGPGIPITKNRALDRMIQMFDAVGPALVVEAMNLYLLKRKGQHAAETLEQGVTPSTPPETVGTPADLTHDGAAGA